MWAIFLDKVNARDCHFTLIRPGAAKLTLRANEHGAGFSIDEHRMNVAIRLAIDRSLERFP